MSNTILILCLFFSFSGKYWLFIQPELLKYVKEILKKKKNGRLSPIFPHCETCGPGDKNNQSLKPVLTGFRVKTDVILRSLNVNAV